ncbi:PTS lactose/cellobiose transporter subunit IIA [Salibacterium lacus]|uniref:PTS lactose/cellobiose transporter subunit IIA n=1 Tax=Salibacterium lacus TaxID=1898109 RepID=A0ABW5T4V9_9BACI
MNYETVVMSIITNGGNGKSNAMGAIREARERNFDQAEELLETAREDISKAHRTQTDLIQAEVRGEKAETTLLMVHAQDHLMNAVTTIDLADEFVEMYKKLKTMEEI